MIMEKSILYLLKTKVNQDVLNESYQSTNVRARIDGERNFLHQRLTNLCDVPWDNATKGCERLIIRAILFVRLPTSRSFNSLN
ncbi:MAG: hypothetical protein DKT66_16680 [Candidatus Melainabacteria bacterium]|nr:MAG: hypothetical protein DKT66_16680 [Candidatus Melainabacteria bacterium]